jgi:hypothetical protein
MGLDAEVPLFLGKSHDDAGPVRGDFLYQVTDLHCFLLDMIL